MSEIITEAKAYEADDLDRWGREDWGDFLSRRKLAIAKAQRDSSDREWVELIKETANIGHGVVYFAIPIEQWQAINEKVEENNDRS